MADDVPPWVTLDHAGLVARWGPTPGTVAGCLGIGALAVVWPVTIGIGVLHEGLDWGLGCMASLTLFLWPLAIGMALEVTDRHELRLTVDGLVWTRWRYGVRRRVVVPLAGTRVSSRSFDGSKGVTHIALVLEPAGGDRIEIPLPGGTSLGDRERTRRRLAWLEGTLAEAVALARPSTEPDRSGREALAALLRRRLGEG